MEIYVQRSIITSSPLKTATEIRQAGWVPGFKVDNGAQSNVVRKEFFAS